MFVIELIKVSLNVYASFDCWNCKGCARETFALEYNRAKGFFLSWTIIAELLSNVVVVDSLNTHGNWLVDFIRRWSLERKLADADVTEEEQNNLLKDLERKETEYMRLQRHKMGVEDFELLTIIGRGAFGEVCVLSLNLHSIFD